jgi:hypothetical protein
MKRAGAAVVPSRGHKIATRLAAGLRSAFGSCSSLPAARSRAPTSETFDSPQPARTIATCPKRVRTTVVQPPDVGARKTRSGTPRLCFCEAARPNAVSRGGRETRTDDRRTMFSRARGRQPRSIYRCTHRYCGVAALGRAAQRPTSGGNSCLRARTFVRRAPSRGLQTEHRVFQRGDPIGHVRYFVSRRVRLGA